MSLTKEQQEKNLINLKNAIDLGSIDQLIKPCDDWGGAYVIITSSEEKILNLKKDDGFYSHSNEDIYVLTKHARILSGLFYYIKENVLEDRDNYLYGFLALLANDYLRLYGESNDYIPLLKYIIDKAYGYFLYFDWKVSMRDSQEAFDVMRNYLSNEISDNEIRKIL